MKLITVDFLKFTEVAKKVGIESTHTKKGTIGTLVLKYHSSTLLTEKTEHYNKYDIVTFDLDEIADLSKEATGDMADGLDRLVGVIKTLPKTHIYEGQEKMTEAANILESALNESKLDETDIEILQDRVKTDIQSINGLKKSVAALAKTMALPPFSTGEYEMFRNILGNFSFYLNEGLINPKRAAYLMQVIDDLFESVMSTQTKVENAGKLLDEVVSELEKAQATLKKMN